MISKRILLPTLLRSCTVWSNGTVSWWECKPKELVKFSVAGHNIASVLRKELNVPVALISMSRGSSSVDSWMPEAYFERPCLKYEQINIKKFQDFNRAGKAKRDIYLSSVFRVRTERTILRYMTPYMRYICLCRQETSGQPLPLPNCIFLRLAAHF